jgi:hypothetical protein
MGGERMNELMRRRRALMAQKAGGGLPSDFQPVAWVGTNNTASYFDTGYTVQKTDKVEIVASRSANKNDQALVQSSQFSIYQSGSGRGYKYGFANWGTSYVGCLNDYVPAIDEVATFTVDVPGRAFTINQTVKTFSAPGTTTENSLKIFSSGTYYGYHQIKSVKIWDSSDSLVVEAIAGYIKSTSEIVFYDTVSKTYLHNLGTGTLIKGADI